ncbi:putative Major facilitator superfamily domain-containing protein [Seiridium cardinale]
MLQTQPGRADLESNGLPDDSNQSVHTKPECPNDGVEPAPDGGFVGWTQVLLTHIVFFNTWGVANGYGVFQNYYTNALGQSASSISWIGSVQVFFLFSGGVFAGRLTDAGYFRPTFTLGVFLQLLGIFMTSLGTRYWQIFLSQAVCLGLGNGLTFVPALSVLSQYFHRNRALAVGLAAAGAAVGGLVYPVLINQLIFHDGFGFPWSMRVMGFIMLATYLPCLILFKPRLPPRKTGPWIDASAFRELPFVFFTLSMFLNFWGLYLAFFYLGTFARDQVGVTEPINLLLVLNGIGVIGRILPNFIADRWTGLFNLLIPLSFTAGLLVYCWAAVHSEAGLYAFAVIYGLIAAALQAIFPAVATTMTPEPSRTGTRVGMILGFVGFANLTGPAICGALIQADGGSYVGAQGFAASSIVLGAFMAVAARVAKVGWEVTVREKSYNLAGKSQVDIVRDVSTLVHARFSAELFMLPLKTKDRPGVLDEYQLYMIHVAVFTCIFMDLGPGASFGLPKGASSGPGAWPDHGGQCQGDQDGWLYFPLNAAHMAKKVPMQEFGKNLVQRLLANKEMDVKNLVLGHMVPTQGGMVPNQAQVFSQVLEYSLSKEGRQYLSEINRLAKSDAPKDFDTLMRYVLEAGRLDGEVGVFRCVAKDTTVQDKDRTLNLKSGDNILVNLREASYDPEKFPNPTELDWSSHLSLTST